MDLTPGTRYLLGGSIATVVHTGTVHPDGVPTPMVALSCPDFGPRWIRLVGNQMYALGPIA